MKKLIIASIAAVVGLAVNAATVDWQYKITHTTGTEGYNSGYTAYLVSATAWDGLASVSADTFTDSSVVLDSTTFGAASGRNKDYTTIASGTTTGARAVSIDSLAEGSTYNVYYVILNTNADPSTYVVANSDTLTGRSATGETALGANTSIKLADLSTKTWTSTAAVPEPTSGLLMLLGMAGLALRRKRA